MFASGVIVNALRVFNNNLWEACTFALDIQREQRPQIPTRSGCEVDETKDLQEIQEYQERLRAFSDRTNWVRQAKKFAANYFRGDVRRMTYCLKRVQVLKWWEDLVRSYQPVDYSLLHEDGDGTTEVTLESACAGGKCEIDVHAPRVAKAGSVTKKAS